jgi:hypothetical protein
METVEIGFEFLGELFFAFDGGFGATQAEAMGDAVDVGIDRHEVGAGVFDHHDVGGFLTHAGEFDELFLFQWDFAAVVLDNALRHLDKIFGFVVEKRAGVDAGFDCVKLSV